MDDPRLEQIRAILGAPSGPRHTVAELATRYMASVEFANLKAKDTEARRLRLHVVPHLGADIAAELTFDRMGWYREQRRGERCLNGRDVVPAPSTRNREVVTLSACLSWAVVHHLLERNPIRGCPLETENNQRRTMPVSGDVDKLLFACTPRLRAMVAMKFGGGLRRQELCSLRLTQVRWDQGLVVLHGRDTKTGRPRVTVLPDRASKIVQRYLDLREERDSPYVFCTASGKPVGPRNFLRDFQRACQHAGIQAAEGERMVLHDLRAGFVGHHLEMGTSERVIMDMGGWSTHSAFDRYVRVQARWLRDAKERADAFDESKRKGPKPAGEPAPVIPISGARKTDE